MPFMLTSDNAPLTHTALLLLIRLEGALCPQFQR